MTNDERKPPLQFSLRAMLGMMVAVALLFGTLRWLGVSTTASAVVLVILVLGMLAAVGLLAAIAGSGDDEH
jgi:hypothetical protein